MGVELIIIGIIAGASVLISGISAATSIGTIFFFKKKFKSSESMESKDTTNVTIKNEAIKEEYADGSTKTTRKQEINITDIDMDIGSKLISGSTTLTRTGLPNETAEILAKGGVGALNKLTAEVLPQVGSLIEGAPEAEVGLGLIRSGIKLIEDSSSEITEKVAMKVKRLEKDRESEGDFDNNSSSQTFVGNNNIESSDVQHKVIASNSAKELKSKTKEVVSVSDILLTVMGDELEEGKDKDALISADQQKEALGDIIEESSGAV